MKSINLFFSVICLFLLFASKLPFAAEELKKHLSFSEVMEYKRQGYSIKRLLYLGYKVDMPESDWNQNPLKPYSIEEIKYITCLVDKAQEQNKVSLEKDIDACSNRAFDFNLWSYDCQTFASIKNAKIAMESSTGECEHLNPKLVQNNCKSLIETVSPQAVPHHDHEFSIETNLHRNISADEEASFNSCCKSARINDDIKKSTYHELCQYSVLETASDQHTLHCEFFKKNWKLQTISRTYALKSQR